MTLFVSYGVVLLGLVAALWYGVYDPPGGIRLAGSFVAGYDAFFLLCAMSLLSARPAARPLWDGKFFLNLHRLLAILLLGLLLLHAALFLSLGRVTFVYLTPAAPWPMLAGLGAGLALLLCFGTSASLSIIKRLYADARHFDLLHRGIAAAAVLLAAVHIVLSRDHATSAVAQALIWSGAGLALLAPGLRRIRIFAARGRKREQKRRRVAAALPARLVLGFALLCLAAALPLLFQTLR
ncbi:hypothetical protein [Acidomonas methanolica]|uniref:hypothetical protein n=1 Tax=Acidomonas methanolica TaxID=437 RepID=UPI002119FB0D|nr:hypothetical protein [Acidomonas methanolica]MCQ9155254.1 hypothetical protein [Acidomonas methanolica]